jgi:hypothetical protein
VLPLKGESMKSITVSSSLLIPTRKQITSSINLRKEILGTKGRAKKFLKIRPENITRKMPAKRRSEKEKKHPALGQARNRRNCSARALLLTLALLICTAPGNTMPSVIYTLDLRLHGFHAEDNWSGLDNSGLTFLSDNLLLVSVVQLQLHGGGNFTDVDSPPSPLFVIDTSKRQIVSAATLPVEHQSTPVQLAGDGKFTLWNQRGVQICDAWFHCGQPLPAHKLRLVSPKGTRAITWFQPNATGWGDLELINLQNMNSLETFPYRRPDLRFTHIIPGDNAVILQDGKSAVVRALGKDDRRIPFDDTGTFVEARFLNASSVVYLSWNESQAVIETLDGKELYRIAVQKAWQAGFIPSFEGARFGVYEYGYTLWNSIVNFLDIDEGRQMNFQKVRIINTSSGSNVVELEWDPRPHLVTPAISPNGHLLARVRGAVLEIVAIP